MQLLESRAQTTSEVGTGSKRQWCGSPETTSQLDFSNGWHNYSFSQQIERKHKTLVQPRPVLVLLSGGSRVLREREKD